MKDRTDHFREVVRRLVADEVLNEVRKHYFVFLIALTFYEEQCTQHRWQLCCGILFVDCSFGPGHLVMIGKDYIMQILSRWWR